ncbi:MAG: ribosome maturation factor RimM [Bryobacteraceae bacterium]
MNSDSNYSEADQGWVTVALLGRARGNRGELTAIPFGKPERYESLRDVFLFPDGSRHEVESAWFHDNRLILKFRGVDTISDAEALQGCEVRVPQAARFGLEAGEFYESDLIGCEVVERSSGASLGRVLGLQETGGPGVLEVEGGLLIPFAREICVAIEPESRRIVVDLPEGLKELNQK